MSRRRFSISNGNFDAIYEVNDSEEIQETLNYSGSSSSELYIQYDPNNEDNYYRNRFRYISFNPLDYIDDNLVLIYCTNSRSISSYSTVYIRTLNDVPILNSIGTIESNYKGNFFGLLWLLRIEGKISGYDYVYAYSYSIEKKN